MNRIRISIAVAVAAFFAISASSSPRSKDPAVTKTVQQFVDAFNTGNIKRAVALCANDMAIIDEFPPYEWHGPGAMTKWLNDYAADAKKKGLTDGVVTLVTPATVDVEGNRAYVVAPADYSFKAKGKSVKETGASFTFALRKTGGGWRIAAWSWSKNNP